MRAASVQRGRATANPPVLCKRQAVVGSSKLSALAAVRDEPCSQMPLTALTIPGQYVSEAVLGLFDSSKFGRDAAAVRFSAILLAPFR